MTIGFLAALLAFSPLGDTRAQTVLDSVVAKLSAAQSMRVRAEVHYASDPAVVRLVELTRRGGFAYRRTERSRRGPVEWFTSPTARWMVLSADKQYAKLPLVRAGEVPTFLGYSLGRSVRATGPAVLDSFAGRPVWRVRLENVAWKRPIGTLLVDRRSSLPVGYESPSDGGTTTIEVTSLDLDIPAAPTSFEWRPGKGWSLAKPANADTSLATLLNAGQPAPEFAVETPSGRTTLAGLLRGKKALILNFWFCNCGACRKEFPHLSETYERLRSAGLDVLAVNVVDSKPLVDRFVKEQKLSIPVAVDDSKASIGKRYGIQSCPTNYVIGPDGRIVARMIGYDAKKIAQALHQLGFPDP